MEILEAYKKFQPDVFARLPLPKDIAEQMGCPIKDDIVSLNSFLKDFMRIQYSEPVHEVETRVACEIVENAEPLIKGESFEITVLPKEEPAVEKTEIDPDMPELEKDEPSTD